MQMTTLSIKIVDVVLTATTRTGLPATVDNAQVALTPSRLLPTASTTWTPVTVTNNVATFTVSGPQAGSSADLVVPTGMHDVWVRIVDDPEIEVIRVGRIRVD